MRTLPTNGATLRNVSRSLCAVCALGFFATACSLEPRASAMRPFVAVPAAVGGVEADDATIEVRPARVYREQTVRLRLVAGDREGDGLAAFGDGGDRSDADADVYWSWSASAGEILSDGALEAHWRAPAKPGEVTLRVRALERGSPSGIELERRVEVHRPSREGMVFIPSGTFVMGDVWTDVDDPYFIATTQNMTDKPAHRVYLDAYWIDRHRVTNAEYAEYLDAALEQGLVRVTDEAVVGWYEGVELPFYYFELKRPRSPITLVPPLEEAIRFDGERFVVEPGKERHAVMDVTWAGAGAYAHFHGRHLPTEAQWERAARGDDLRLFPWGDTLPTPYHANMGGYHGDRGLPVGAFSPVGDSPFGVADLMGSFEWVEDWYGEFYYRDTHSDIPVRNPTGPEWGLDHPARGLSRLTAFVGNEEYLTPLAFRYQWVFEFGYGQLFAHNETGFRTALPATEADRRAHDDRQKRPREDLPVREPSPFPLPRDQYPSY